MATHTPQDEAADVTQSLFDPGAGAPESTRKYEAISPEAPTREGKSHGLAFVGKRGGSTGGIFLVHEVGRQTEAVALHAVVALVAGGVIPPADVVGGYKRLGKLADLKKAIEQA